MSTIYFPSKLSRTIAFFKSKEDGASSKTRHTLRILIDGLLFLIVADRFRVDRAVAFAVEAVFLEFFVEGVAIDAEAGGGLDLNAVARGKDLLDQLALDLADDHLVQLVRAWTGGLNALADEFGG